MTAPIEKAEYGKRVAYVADEDWSWVRRVAFLQNVTISAVVRGLIRLGRDHQDQLMADVTGDSGPFNVNHHRWSDAQRAVILGETVPDDPALTERVAAGVLSRLAADATLVKPPRPAPKPVIVSPMDFHTPKTPVAEPPGVPTNKAFSEFRPAPKPTSRKKR